VFEHEIDYPRSVLSNVSIRYIAGLGLDVATMPRRERLERNTLRLAALGNRLPDVLLARARTNESAIARRMNHSFDRADVVITPMTAGPLPCITEVAHHGLARSLWHSNVAAWAAPWNAIGQPAASLPSGFDADGLPLAVQLCGRRSDEETLLRLAAQLETARPWADLRPPSPARW
jgi:amidase